MAVDSMLRRANRAQAGIQRLHDRALVGAGFSRVGVRLGLRAFSKPDDPPSCSALWRDKSAFAEPSAFAGLTADKTSGQAIRFRQDGATSKGTSRRGIPSIPNKPAFTSRGHRTLAAACAASPRQRAGGIPGLCEQACRRTAWPWPRQRRRRMKSCALP